MDNEALKVIKLAFELNKRITGGNWVAGYTDEDGIEWDDTIFSYIQSDKLIPVISSQPEYQYCPTVLDVDRHGDMVARSSADFQAIIAVPSLINTIIKLAKELNFDEDMVDLVLKD